MCKGCPPDTVGPNPSGAARKVPRGGDVPSESWKNELYRDKGRREDFPGCGTVEQGHPLSMVLTHRPRQESHSG